MHTNSKKSADIIPNTNGLRGVKVKTRGFVTYRDPVVPKARRWALVSGSAPIIERPILKSQAALLPSPLPLGVAVIQRQMGAVKRFVLTGTESAIQVVLGALKVS